jgi:hypothetical protein
MNWIVRLAISGIWVLTICAANALGSSGANLPHRLDTDTSDLDWVISKVIHTAKTRLAVNQTGQVGCGYLGSSFTYFADSTKDRIDDGSLILGNAADNLSWRIWNGYQPAPTPANLYGPMLAMSDLTIDSTSSPSYTFASGKGTNRDSTIGFDVEYYAPKHIDSSDFYIARFKIYKGMKDPLGIYSPLMIAFATDWDVPADSAVSNSGGCDVYRQMLYQRGESSLTMQQQFGAMAAFREDNAPIVGGFIWDNVTQVYPRNGFQADSVWKYSAQANGFTCATPITDLSSILVIGRNLSIDGAAHDTLTFHIVLMGQLNGSLAGLQRTVNQARTFFCGHIGFATCYCDGCCACGDANSDRVINISDAVFIIQYVFAGGSAPASCWYLESQGDANGDSVVNIADAVFLITYIFSNGDPPHCAGG